MITFIVSSRCINLTTQNKFLEANRFIDAHADEIEDQLWKDIWKRKQNSSLLRSFPTPAVVELEKKEK